MQTPPPFHGYEGQPAPQKPKSNVAIILFVVLGVLLVCCGLPMGIAGYYGFKGFKGAMAIGGCVANVEGMKVALRDYERAHDGKLPSAATWQTDLGKYLVFDKDTKDSPLKMWKANGEWSCEESGVKTGFMFNEDLSEKKASDVVKKNPDAIAIFETKTIAQNQSGKMQDLPFSESPKIMSEFLNERRGWLLIGAEANTISTKNAKGRLTPFNMNSKSSKNGFDFSMDSNSDSKSSKDSSDSKDDNSN